MYPACMYGHKIFWVGGGVGIRGGVSGKKMEGMEEV